MTIRERTEALLAEAESYDGTERADALWGELDCRVELMILDEMETSAP